MKENDKDEKRCEDQGAQPVGEEIDLRPAPLDGGWGWMVVLGSALNHIVFGIVVCAFGVMYIELLDRYKGSATATAWIGAINMSAAGLLAPIVSMLALRFSCRVIAVTGGVLICVGVVATAFAPNLVTVYFTFGATTGIGLALAYTPGFISVGEYFEKRKALAMSLATFASGLGAMFPPVMLYLFEHYGYKGGVLIIGGITFNACIGGMLYRPLADNYIRKKKPVEAVRLSMSRESLNKKMMPKILQASMESLHSLHSLKAHRHNKEEASPLTAKDEAGDEAQGEAQDEAEDEAENKVQDKAGDGAKTKDIQPNDEHIKGVTFHNDTIHTETKTKRPVLERKESVFHRPNPKQSICNLSLMKDYRFLSLSYVILCNALNLGLVSAFVPVLAIERGLPVSRAVSLLTISGLASTIGTLVLGPLTDLQVVRPWRIKSFNFCLTLVGLTSLFNPFANTYAEFIAFSTVRGIFAGHVMSQRATIVADIVGKEKLNLAVGMVLFSTALGLISGRAIGGVVKDTTGLYDLAFYIAGGVTLLGCAVFQFTECWYSRAKAKASQ